MGDTCGEEEAALIRHYGANGLPPVCSREAIATMFGYNPGFIWSLLEKTEKHYRLFTIPKGRGQRSISAPRVGLKLIQRWLNLHWSLVWLPPECVHGFIAGKSHVSAAKFHRNARWVISADIADFFPSVKTARVRQGLEILGYADHDSLEILEQLVCLDGALTQGAPTSPILSNIALMELDTKLETLAAEVDAVYTRYADDIVFSGKNDLPEGLDVSIKALIAEDGWTLSEEK